MDMSSSSNVQQLAAITPEQLLAVTSELTDFRVQLPPPLDKKVHLSS